MHIAMGDEIVTVFLMGEEGGSKMIVEFIRKTNPKDSSFLLGQGWSFFIFGQCRLVGDGIEIDAYGSQIAFLVL